jgi:hypothetical protein
MKKILLLSVILLASFAFTYRQAVGKAFPELKGETLTDKPITFPDDTKGKYTLLGLALSRKAEEDLQSWLNPSYNKFVLKSGLMDAGYDVNTYFVPMYTGISQPVSGIGKKNMKEGTDKNFYPYLVYYKGEAKKYREGLKLEDKETPYIFLLDKDGVIVYSTSGKYTDKKMEEIEEKLN